MSHIGLLCPPTPGHLNPMSTLGRVLRARGHRVTMFQLPDVRARVEREGMEFWALGEGKHETGELASALGRLGQLSGLTALRFTIACAARLAHVVFQYAPAALSQAKVDLALIDQNEPAGATVAEHLGLPFISVAALPLNREPNIPPPFAPWPYGETKWARVRNRIGYAVADHLLRPLTAALNDQRRQWGLSCLRSPDDSFSRVAQLCTLPKALDFPRRDLPSCFHYLGPFTDADRPSVDFPWELLDGRTLVYASFGTLLNRMPERFRAVAEACHDLDVQLVLSTGGGPLMDQRLPGNPLVVPYAPQLELLGRASLAVTHSGLNTVLEALSCGVPMVAVPVTNDQPAVASRLKRFGAAEVVEFSRLSPDRLRAAIRRVMKDGSYRNRVRILREEIAGAGGVLRAADIVEDQLFARRGPARIKGVAASN